jgi:hypothetical protein
MFMTFLAWNWLFKTSQTSFVVFKESTCTFWMSFTPRNIVTLVFLSFESHVDQWIGVIGLNEIPFVTLHKFSLRNTFLKFYGSVSCLIISSIKHNICQLYFIRIQLISSIKLLFFLKNHLNSSMALIPCWKLHEKKNWINKSNLIFNAMKFDNKHLYMYSMKRYISCSYQ